MKPVRLALVASILMGFASGSLAGEIIRCVSANGAVTYQAIACPDAAREQVTNISNDYPPINMAERERLLANERDLYKRLEAQRDRDTALELARQARAASEARAREAEAAAAADAEPYYLAWPARPVRPAHHQRVARGNQPAWTGGNPLSPGFSQ